MKRFTAAYGKSRLFCLRRCIELGLAALLVSLAGLATPSAAAQENPSANSGPQAQGNQQSQSPFTIERIDFVGNRRIRRDVLQARIFSHAGDPLNAAALDRDYHALWNTNYFDDVKLSIEDSPTDPTKKIVIFTVVERPTIRRIVYKGNKSVSESDILDAFKDRKVGLTQDSPFDPTKVKKAEVVIRDLLADHGHQFAVIKENVEHVAATNSVILTFNIEEGAKVEVGKIIIEGNKTFSSRRIIRTMHHSRPYGFDIKIIYMNVMAKTFDQAKLDEDLELGIRSLYQDNGFYEANVSVDHLESVDLNRRGIKLPVPVVGSKHGKATNIYIKIEENERFRMGKLFIINADPEKGLTLRREALVSVFPLKEGEIFNVDKIRKAIENYTKLYGRLGFMDFTAEPDFEINHVKKTIDVTLRFSEQKPYTIHRINISGNVTTRDKVIRRELLLSEGDLYDNHLWEYSVLKLNQLGFFEQLKPETAAQVSRNIKNSTVDLNLKVKEKQKQSISFTGGVSGLAGDFLGLSYQTRNFLGLGETLTISTQYGTVQKGFNFSFSEPYFLDRPISTGFSVFASKYNFDQARQTSLLLGQAVNLSPAISQNYNQNSKGFSLFASYPVKRWKFARVGLTYKYTITDIVPFSTASQEIFEDLQFQAVAGPSALNGIHQSQIVASISYTTVDYPPDPHTGKSYYYSFSFEGGPLGGNTKAISQVFTATYYRPNYHRRNTIALRFLGTFATSYGGSELPPFERTFAGGEQDLRGFDLQTVSPVAFIPIQSSLAVNYFDPRKLDGSGNPILQTLNVPYVNYSIAFPGGDTEGIFNAEYRIPIVKPVSFSLFFDSGINGALQRNQLNLDSSGLAALEQALPNTNISRHLILAQGSNFRPRASVGAEFVVQLPVIQAPFRLYWSYNFLRYNELLVAPPGDFFISNDIKNSLPPGVLDFQILPQITHTVSNPAQFRYTDPLTTLRFTVSRTF
ncbi:MAG TPA: outer membrane protein assembly factor BamA [Candidatus Acidoferrum sp.]|nr:outer membrane protein assembly factor BamA [Candidatus Acidoferrum sp.]